jgi:hypothetical protein
MNPEHLLAKLYYEIGKQNTNFALQHSRREGEEVIWTKRKTFLELDPDKDKWFIAHANHRQILKNEIIFDFDRIIPRNNALEDYDVQTLIKTLTEADWPFCVYHTGSKGIHVHIYLTALISLSIAEREEYRKVILKHPRIAWFAGVDLQKASDKTMIALEHVPHWRTGVTKELLHKYGEGVW